jgi:hypothetical protein
LTGRLLLIVRSLYPVSNLECASARASDVCPYTWKRPAFEGKTAPSHLPTPWMPRFWAQKNELSNRICRKLIVPGAQNSIQYP